MQDHEHPAEGLMKDAFDEAAAEGQLCIEDIEKNKEFEEINVSRDTNICQSNYLIENRPKMTTDELKMFSTLIASIDRGDSDLKNIKLKVTNIVDLWGINQKNAYKQVKTALSGLLDKKFALEKTRSDGLREIEMATYITRFTYIEGSGTANVEVSSRFSDLLLDLKERYTLLALRDILELDFPPAIRTYELLKQYEKLGQRTFVVSDYKKKVGIEDKYKGNNSNLKKYALNSICKEISEKTSILTRYTLEGRGDSAILTFTIYSKEEVTKNKPSEKNFDAEKDILLQLLVDEYHMDCHFSQEQIKRAIDIATEGVKDRRSYMGRFSVIKDAFIEYQDRKTITEIQNDWAYFKKILEAKSQYL